MHPYLFTLLFQLNGFGAASGITEHQNQVYIVSDDSDYLFLYDTKKQNTLRFPIRENAQLQRTKKEKMDLEAIARKGNSLYIFGSGSKENRRIIIQFDLKNKKYTSFDYSKEIELMTKSSGIPEKEINIEGAILKGLTLLLFNRGNGKNAHNGIFKVKFRNGKFGDNFEYQAVPLPKINGEIAGFSDAIYKNGKIYFLATGERSENVIADGEIAGTYFGILNPKDFSVLEIQKISDHNKFEGLTFHQRIKGEKTFLICEDSDNAALSSTIYELKKETF